MIKIMFSKFLSLAIPYTLFFFAPLVPLLIGTLILVTGDLLTGIKAAKIRGEKITSKKMQNTILKALFYFLAIILARVMEVMFHLPIPVAALVGGFIGLTEFKSNMENISVILGINLWKYLSEKIKSLSNK